MAIQSIRVNKSTEVLISPVVEDDIIDGPLYAINWFNLNRPWLYGIYAKLAYPHVAKAGGKVLFKAKVTNVLLGNDTLNREQLLIVKYPSAMGFLNMLMSKLFLLKSILRIKSVADFTFGFCKREDNGSEPPDQILHYSEKKNYIVLNDRAHYCEFIGLDL